MDDPLVYELATRNRLIAADMFASLSEEQWRTPSLCTGWTVREVCAHLVPPRGGVLTTLGLVVKVVRFRGDLDRMVDDDARTAARRPTNVLVADLRAGAEVRFKAPVVGPYGPMTDTALHLRDAARPLGLTVMPDDASWPIVLDFLTGSKARGFVAPGRLAGLSLVPTDVEGVWGDGEVVRGPAEAVAMAAAGREVALAELDGPGVAVLADRLSAGPT